MTHLLFLHGVGGGHHAWDHQLPYFADRGYPAHAWDQPGYGHTPLVDPYDLEQVAASLRRLIDTLEGPVVLVGHSMGGMVAQEAYARNPQRIAGLVLAFTSAAFPRGGSDFTRQFIETRVGPLDAGATMADVAARLMPTMRGTKSEPAGVEQARKIMSEISPDTYRNAVQLLTTFDRKADLQKIAVPTLLVAGSDDKTAPPSVMERMAKDIPDADFVVLEGCGHLGPMDQPQAFNAALEDFLKRKKL
jgi:pimeloyl-ACP methyl ester carboxylesterase